MKIKLVRILSKKMNLILYFIKILNFTSYAEGLDAASTVNIFLIISLAS
jgi:hypothetical protein